MANAPSSPGRIIYPNRRFDIAAEQDALLKADVIVLQFPFSWYSVPGLMKLWIDEVFVHGFAHGSTAKLGGKKLIVSFTTGAPATLYQKDGFFKHSVEDYLPQFETFAALCGLDYQQPVYTCGIGYGYVVCNRVCRGRFSWSNGHLCPYSVWFGR